MNAGPSKEQLESLFKTSRKYFDELAKDYYAKDRDFYNKNFAPFYSNPLIVAKRGGKSAKYVIAVSILALIIGLTAILLMFFIQENSDKKQVRETDKYQEAVKKDNNKPATSVKDSVEKENVRIEKLEEEMLKKEKEVNQKESEVRENTSKREVRSKPIERTR